MFFKDDYILFNDKDKDLLQTVAVGTGSAIIFHFTPINYLALSERFDLGYGITMGVARGSDI
ncbi:MAG: hypothetical protein U9N53_00035 [Bacteroidota bacterium]|nr:hypothetical protein [Bacteroidota bacterium]